MGDEAITYTYIDTDECPVIVYRASAVGGCIAALVASRLGMEPAPPSDKFLAIFQRGHEAEVRIKQDLISKGWEIEEEQSEYDFIVSPGNPETGKPRIVIRCHVDGIGRFPDNGTIRQLIECKRMAKDSYNRWVKDNRMLIPPNGTDDILRRRYAWQTSIYCHAIGLSGFRICVETDASGPGKLSYDISGWEHPHYTPGQIRARILGIENLVKKGSVPSCDVKSFPCPYYYLHDDANVEKQDVTKELGEVMLEIVQQQVMAKAIKDNLDNLNAKALKLMEAAGHGNVGSRAQAKGIGSISVLQSTTTDYKKLIADYSISDLDKYKGPGKKYVRVTASSDSSDS